MRLPADELKLKTVLRFHHPDPSKSLAIGTEAMPALLSCRVIAGRHSAPLQIIGDERTAKLVVSPPGIAVLKQSGLVVG
jgi:hypothetical protein